MNENNRTRTPLVCLFAISKTITKREKLAVIRRIYHWLKHSFIFNAGGRGYFLFSKGVYDVTVLEMANKQTSVVYIPFVAFICPSCLLLNGTWGGGLIIPLLCFGVIRGLSQSHAAKLSYFKNPVRDLTNRNNLSLM